MKTYGTYQQAKAENPNSDILVSNVGKFHAAEDTPSSHFANGWKLCDPADYEDTVEWKNGDKCIFSGSEYIFGCVNPVCDQGSVVIFDGVGDCHGVFIGELSKPQPETLEQRKERENLEAAYDLYCRVHSAQGWVAGTFEWFLRPETTGLRDRYLITSGITNYTVGR